MTNVGSEKPQVQVLYFWLHFYKRGRVCKRSVRTLATDCGVTANTVRKSMSRLVDMGLVQPKSVIDDNGQFLTNEYLLMAMFFVMIIGGIMA